MGLHSSEGRTRDANPSEAAGHRVGEDIAVGHSPLCVPQHLFCDR